MPSVIDLYERLSTAPDDKTRARIIAEAFEALEERYPNLSDVATRQNLRETELRLQKEIEQVRADLTKEIEKIRAELKETELSLRKEIEQVRGEIRETELRLQKEIESVKLELQKEIDQVRLEIKSVEIRLTRAIHHQTLWVIGSIGAIIALIRLLEWFLAHVPQP